jgi:hypothetical protein
MLPPGTIVLLSLAYLMIREVDANGNGTSQTRMIRNTYRNLANDPPEKRKDLRRQRSHFRKGEFKKYTNYNKPKILYYNTF